MKERANPITGHQLTFMPGDPGNPAEFGWIRLVNGVQSAGYIYLTSPPVQPHLSFDGTYIVTSIPMAELHTMLDILRNEKNLQIRFFDSETAGSPPSVFIEDVNRILGSVDAAFNVHPDIHEEVAALRARTSG